MRLPRKVSIRDRLRIHEIVSGGILDCGCAVGRYLTYAGAILTIVDDSTACRQSHTRGLILQEAAAGESCDPLPEVRATGTCN